MCPSRISDWGDGALRALLSLETRSPHPLNCPPQKQHEASRAVAGAYASSAAGPPWTALLEVTDAVAQFGAGLRLGTTTAKGSFSTASPSGAGADDGGGDGAAEAMPQPPDARRSREASTAAGAVTDKMGTGDRAHKLPPIGGSAKTPPPPPTAPAKAAGGGDEATDDTDEDERVIIPRSNASLSGGDTDGAGATPEERIASFTAQISALTDTMVNSYVSFPPPAIHYRVQQSALLSAASSPPGTPPPAPAAEAATAATPAKGAAASQQQLQGQNGSAAAAASPSRLNASFLSSVGSTAGAPLAPSAVSPIAGGRGGPSPSSAVSPAYSVKDKRRGIVETLKKTTTGAGLLPPSPSSPTNRRRDNTVVSLGATLPPLVPDADGGAYQSPLRRGTAVSTAASPTSASSQQLQQQTQMQLQLQQLTRREREERFLRKHLASLLEVFARRRSLIARAYPTIPSTPPMAAPASHFHPAICLLVFNNPPPHHYSSGGGGGGGPLLSASVGSGGATSLSTTGHGYGGGGGGAAPAQQQQLLDQRLRQLQEFGDAQRRYALCGNVQFAYWDLSSGSGSGPQGGGVSFSATQVGAEGGMSHLHSHHGASMGSTSGAGGAAPHQQQQPLTMHSAFAAVAPHLFTTVSKLMAVPTSPAGQQQNNRGGGGAPRYGAHSPASASFGGEFGGSTPQHQNHLFGGGSPAGGAFASLSSSPTGGGGSSNNKDGTPLQCLSELIRSSLLPPADYPALLLVEPHRRRLYRVLWSGAEFYPSAVIAHFVDEFLRGALLELLPPIKGARVTGPPQRMRHALVGVY